MADSQTDPNQPVDLTSHASESEPEIVEAHAEEQPTISHALADEATVEEPPEDKGEAQIQHGDIEVKNLGWNEESNHVPHPLVGGLTNEDLWTLIRRFNKQVFSVKSIPEAPIGQLDLEIAEDEEFSPEKLRSHLERLYMTVVVGLFAFGKHIVRLRSWREWKRTSAFLAVYTAAWLVDYLVPTLVAFLMVLIVYPASRAYCFPPAPPALIDGKTGGVKKPVSGVLGSEDSLTGAPEKHQGEAVEQEAHTFVNSISTIIVGAAAGTHPQNTPGDKDSDPGPAGAAVEVSDAAQQASGDRPAAHHDKTKKPVSEAVWAKAKPVMRGIADTVDTWERMGNALSPTKPFPQERPRLTLAAVLLPIFLGSLFVNSYMVMKGTGFAIGFGFFGDPLQQRGLEFLNRTYPRWKKYVELRNTLLKGIPTNAQLTLTLLRIGERNKAPLPPPPTEDQPPAMEAHPTATNNLEHLGATDEEIEQAAQPDEETLAEDEEAAKKPKKKSKIMAFLKGTTAGGVKTAVGADKVKAAVGAKHAKDRLGAVKSGPDPATGPVRFPARYKGKKGHAYVTIEATTPALSWTASTGDLDPAWTVTIGDIEELRKVGGLGWKSKLVVGWAMEREVADGIFIQDARGNEWHLTALAQRDELFNRLVALGPQMWEAW